MRRGTMAPALSASDRQKVPEAVSAVRELARSFGQPWRGRVPGTARALSPQRAAALMVWQAANELAPAQSHAHDD